MKHRQRIGAIILALFSFFFLLGCQKTELTIKRVEIDPTLQLVDVDLADFELSDLSLILTYSDDSTEKVTVTSNMISSLDLAKLNYMGNHTIKITYEGFEVNVTISLTDSVTLGHLATFYQYAVDTLGFSGSYEAWVLSLTAGSALTIIKAEFNAQNEFILTFSSMQTQNLGQMSSTVFTVTFYDFYGALISTQQVPIGGTAVPPTAPTVLDYNFTGWSESFVNVQQNLEIHANYVYAGVPISDVDNADELILSLTRLQEAQFEVNLDAIFSTTRNAQSVKRARNTFDIYGNAVITDTSDGFNPSEFIPHNYWQSFYYHQGLYQQPQVVEGYQVITSTLSSYSSHALNNLFEVNGQVTDHARDRANWAVDYMTVMDTWVDFGDYLYLLHYDEALDRVELYTIWTNEIYGVTSYEKIFVYYNSKGEEVVESWVEQIYEDTSVYPGVLGYHNSIAGRDFNYYAIWLDENYQPTTQRHYRGINLNNEGVYEYYDGSMSMISGAYGWYTVYPGIDSEREMLYYPENPTVTVYSPDATSDVFTITPMFDVGYHVEVCLPSMRGVEALLIEDGGMIQKNQDSPDTQNMLINQGFTPMPDWWEVDKSNPALVTGFRTSKGTYMANPNATGDVSLKRLDIEIGSEGNRVYDTYFNYFGKAVLYVNATNMDELVLMLTAYFEEIGLTYKYGNTAQLFLEVQKIFENYEAIGRKISIVNDIAPLPFDTYASFQTYQDTHAFITSYLSVREVLLGMQTSFGVITQDQMPSKDDLNKITLIDTEKNTTGSLQAVDKEISSEGVSATLKRSPLLQQGKSYTLYYALQVGGRLITLGSETPQTFTGQDLTFQGNISFVIPEDLGIGNYELVVFFGKVVEDSYLRISNPLALPILGLTAYHVTTPDDLYEMATDTYVYTVNDRLMVKVENIDLYPPKVIDLTDDMIYQGQITIDEWMMPLGSTVQDLINMFKITDNFDGLMDLKVAMIQKDGFAVNLYDTLTETGWVLTVTDLASNVTKITFEKISFGYTVMWMWGEDVIEKMIVKPGETITPIANPEKSGYTFIGWDTNDFTINENRVIRAEYSVNTYTITWMYDGQVYRTDVDVSYGTEITPLEMAPMEGYFFRWNLDSHTMPANDLIVTGSYVQHEYYITYYLDGIYHGSQSYHVGDTIQYLTPHVPEGMVFSGWDISFETMPGSHLEAHGTMTTPNPA